MNANDMQVAGNHYASDYQHWDFVHDALEGRYMEGAITKYVSRGRKKNGVQDLHKAAHFVTKLIELFKAGHVIQPLQTVAKMEYAYRFCAANQLNEAEMLVVKSLVKWEDESDLRFVANVIKTMITEATPETSQYASI